ncbi:hypothetical protein PVK06_004835 [Gossypium arboreum]|uniref:Uncharacterized protein n=1 Tax=Gossypium arboreum TaxID=29729 RepID=A0ABR0QT17_GOSAR|nr:hypothetical protein PVK06_004835 [Gossypium arboreum]
MLEDTQSREGDCQIASFDSILPQIVCMDCRRNGEDELKGIWQSWDEAKKTSFRDKYGDVAQLLLVKLDDALLKAMIDKGVNPTLVVLAKTIISLNFIGRKGDRRFLGCTQLFFIWIKSHFRCLYKHFRQVFVLSTRPIEEFLESEWPSNQSIEEWIQNLSTLTYQKIE